MALYDKWGVKIDFNIVLFFMIISDNLHDVPTYHIQNIDKILELRCFKRQKSTYFSFTFNIVFVCKFSICLIYRPYICLRNDTIIEYFDHQ